MTITTDGVRRLLRQLRRDEDPEKVRANGVGTSPWIACKCARVGCKTPGG